MRVGIGYDIHRLETGRKLMLAGVEIPFIKGLLGHSDADVVCHALCDALLGAMGESDIGELFPDTDPKYSGIDSTGLLKLVCGLLKEKNLKINNVDVVVIAEEPRLSPFKKRMRERLASVLEIDETGVNIKAKTNEGLGETGAKLAISCYAVALLA